MMKSSGSENMFAVHQHVDNFSGKYHNKVKNTCRPLFETFGANYFFYQMVSKGRLVSVLSNVDFAHTYVELNLLPKNPFLTNPLSFHSGVYLLDYIESSELQDSQRIMTDRFKIRNPLMLVKQEGAVTHQIGIGIPLDQPGVQNILVNQLPLIYQFVTYFESEFASIFKEAFEQPILLEGLFSKEKSEIGSPFIKNSQKLDFLKKIRSQRISLQFPQFTERQIECLRYYVRSKTSIDIAHLLNISQRTVEHHIEAVKNKLNCNKKSEIISFLEYANKQGFYSEIFKPHDR